LENRQTIVFCRCFLARGLLPHLWGAVLSARASDRKLRLFACGCISPVRDLLLVKRHLSVLQIVELVEEFIDAPTDIESLRQDVRSKGQQERRAAQDLVAVGEGEWDETHGEGNPVDSFRSDDADCRDDCQWDGATGVGTSFPAILLLPPPLRAALNVARLMRDVPVVEIRTREITYPPRTSKFPSSAEYNDYWDKIYEFKAVATDECRRARQHEGARQSALQSGLVREVLGNPFRPITLLPAILARHDATIQRLAGPMYDALVFDRLPLLADALEDAGCTDAELLGHLRGPGPHVRGRRALDLVLGKS
jgi:hypothetical protein